MKRIALPVIAVCACATLSFASADGGRTARGSEERSQVIVVGAGIAGLTSAVTLAKNGVDAILLERDNRVGGKMLTRELDGIPANVGTQFLFPDIHPLINYYLGLLPLQPWKHIGTVWQGRFHRLPENQFDVEATGGPLMDLELAFDQFYIDWYFAKQGKEWFFDMEPKNDLWNALDRMTCHDYLAKFPQDVYDYMDTMLGGETGGDIHDMSALVLVGWEGDPNAGKWIVKGGNATLAEKMADDFVLLGGRLRLNSEVAEIVQDGNSVRVTCGDGREFVADYAIVATPADVAGAIVKDLPPEKANALGAVNYSHMVEVALHVRNFPGGDELAGFTTVGECTDGIINQTGFIAGYPSTGTVLSATIADQSIVPADDETLVRCVGEVLRKVNPAFDPDSDILNYAVERWQKGVVVFSAGYFSNYQTALREPVGRVYFAGDYTGDPSLMGAAWSGSRAAKAVRDTLPPILSIEPGALHAGSPFDFRILLAQTLAIPFDFYVFAETHSGLYSLHLDGRVSAGIQPLYRGVRGFQGPFEKTVTSGVALPASMNGQQVTFYAVAVLAGKVPSVSSPSALSSDTFDVILFSKAAATVVP